MEKENDSSIIVFGEVLFDRFPDGASVLGGAPFNVAWNLHAFGLAPIFISRVGDDTLGQTISSTMNGWGMSTSFLQLDHSHPTGTVDVSIENNEPSFDIINDRAYDFIDYNSIGQLPEDAILYHGSLALRSRVSVETLRRIRQNSRASTFVDINLRPPWWDLDLITDILSSSRWAKLNASELHMVVSGASGLEQKAGQALKLYGLEYIVITLGKDGALALSSEGARYSIAPESNADIVDTVGAGDAFSSVMLLGELKRWPLETTLNRAQEFASAIVGVQGATTNNKVFYQQFTDSWRV